MLSICFACFFFFLFLTSVLSLLSICLSDSVSSVLCLFNCIINHFPTVAALSLSRPLYPLSPLLPVQINETAQALPLPLTLLILFALSFSEYFSLPLCFLWLCPSPTLAPVSLSVCLSLLDS